MPASNVTGLAHVCMSVRDITRSCRLYQDLLGFAPAEEQVKDTMRILLLQNGPAAIELIQHTPPREAIPLAGPIDHIALMVRDMDALVRELRGAGYVFESEYPIEVPDYFGGIRIIFFSGPDSERIELIQKI